MAEWTMIEMDKKLQDIKELLWVLLKAQGMTDEAIEKEIERRRAKGAW